MQEHTPWIAENAIQIKYAELPRLKKEVIEPIASGGGESTPQYSSLRSQNEKKGKHQFLAI